jgi:hypothetical protein
VGDAGLTQPEHGPQELIKSCVRQDSIIGLGQSSAGRQPGHQRSVPAGPEPAHGEHLGHQDAGAPRHQGEKRLVLDLLQTIENEGGP